MSRILIVDDDLPLLRALSISLGARGYELDVARTGEDALDLAIHRHPDLILLDLGLPGIDGIEVVRGLRGWNSVPIIILSARHQSAAKVALLDAGADDYVTKPFAMDELLARIRVNLRRTVSDEETARVETPSFLVDLGAKQVLRDGVSVHLTRKEWEVVSILVRNPGRLITQRQLLQEVWGPSYEKETEYLRVLLARVRRKLEPDPSHPQHFLTEAGMGYRFVP
jgi:two-component system KDP operon response regulator KdpE